MKLKLLTYQTPTRHSLALGATDIVLISKTNALAVIFDNIKSASDYDQLKNGLKYFKEIGVERSDIFVYSCRGPLESNVSSFFKLFGITNIKFLDQPSELEIAFPQMDIFKKKVKPKTEKRIEKTIKKINILIVEDSSPITKILKNIFSNIIIVANIYNAETLQEATALLKKYEVDLVSLDMMLPDGNGKDFLKMHSELANKTILVTDCLKAQSELVLEALSLGAVAYLKKPSYEQMDEFKESLNSFVSTHFDDSSSVATPASDNGSTFSWDDKKLILIGSSTGGTEVVKFLLEKLPMDAPPIVIVQHMPEAFTGAFAERLTKQAKRKTIEVRSPQQLQIGCAYLAAGGNHIEVYKESGRLWVRPNNQEEVNRFKPSVSVLFGSAHEQRLSKNVVAIMLTGMGHDGALEMKKLRDAGAFTFGQSKETCVVYGMPRSAAEAGAVICECSPQRIVSICERAKLLKEA